MPKKCVVLIILLFLCGCSSIPQGTISGVEESESLPDATLPEIELTETYINYTFSESDELFLSESVFVGDSIIRGLIDNGFLSDENVLAWGGVTVGEIMERMFPLPTGDGEVDLLTAIVNRKPENVFILLGTNNAALYGQDGIGAFTEDYLRLISLIKTYSSETAITVLSITPVNIENERLNNELIGEYNNALDAAVAELRDENVRFLSLDEELKNSLGLLKTRYGQNDGVHLTAQAYRTILWTICDSNN
ncbi:MAG: GDSL-type esterase/lipase family protein [Oscillospiraceae bacterium]|nr:GDSL-type esterase/lipase family protein [Oscillospiraceae bacterium]